MCIFCKIINGEIPSYKIYEDNDVVAFLDISQATVGHTLVVTKKHYSNILELDNYTANKIFSVVCTISKAIAKSLDISDLNILNNNGANAGQTVEHFHIHIIPRYEKNDLKIEFSSNKLSDKDFQKLCDDISSSL